MAGRAGGATTTLRAPAVGTRLTAHDGVLYFTDERGALIEMR